LAFSHCTPLKKRYYVSREEAGGNSGLLHKEMIMSREDDFFGDFNESTDDVDTGQEGTSEPLMDESPAEEPKPPMHEPARPTAPRAKPKAKKKAKTAKKKVAKTTRKPAPKKPAKKKTTAAKKKKATRPKK
jgi:hypothetical protein